MMLGQGQLDTFVSFALAAATTLAAASRGLTFLVDRTRDALPFGDDPRFRILWGLEALALGLVATLGFGIDLIGSLVDAMPKAGDLNDTVGQVLTAVALAGLASSWHDRDKAKNPPAPTT